MDAILTVATGTEFCKNPYLQVFFKSLSKVYKGDIIVFTHDMSQDIRNIVQGYGCEIVEIDPSKIVYILHDRFIFYHEFLSKRKYDRVLLVDVKDVYFQDNPFADAPKDQPFVWLAGEGGKQCQSDWNTEDQRKCQFELKDEYRRDLSTFPVLNAGTIMGTADEIKNLSLLIWSQTLRTTQKFTDQGALNYLWQFLQADPIYRVHLPQDSLWVATGQGLAEGWFKARWDNGKLYVRDRPYAYCMFHQWDRTGFRDSILEKMGLLIRKDPEPVRESVCPKCMEVASISFT